MKVEVCVQGISSALAATSGGADRVELCEDLRVGGVTPSAGIIAVVCRRLTIPVHVLVRPRGGDFVYTDDEFAAMCHDVRTAKQLGAAGVVIGILTEDGRVDAPRTRELIELARPLSVTFHKAFDETNDPFQAIQTLQALGIDRILTSGQAATARAGLSQIQAFTRRTGDRMRILPGGSIRAADIPALHNSGLSEVHVGSAIQVNGVTDASLVRSFVDAARLVDQGGFILGIES